MRADRDLAVSYWGRNSLLRARDPGCCEFKNTWVGLFRDVNVATVRLNPNPAVFSFLKLEVNASHVTPSIAGQNHRNRAAV